MAKRIKAPIGVRFCDTDMIGHVNNCAIAEYAEYGRVTFFRAMPRSANELILVNLNIDFKAQMHLDDEVWVETWIESIGNSSITLVQDITANGKIAAQTRAVAVTFDYEANQPVRVSDDLRAHLAPYVAAATP